MSYYNENGPYTGGNQLPVGKKCSGKASAYWEFVKEEGAELFRRDYKRRYDKHSTNDKNIMSAYYKSLSETEKARFVQKAADLNKDPKDILRRRQIQTTARRNAQHGNPRGYLEEKELHRMMIERESMRNERCIAIPGALGYKIPVFNSEVQKEREKHTKSLENWNNFQMLNISYNPYLKDDQQFIVLSITPITSTYEYLLHQITAFPAEIGATYFNIKSGVLESKSIFVQFPFEWFYHGQDPTANEESRKKATTELGIPEKGRTDGETPLNAFKFVLNLLGKSKKLFIDAYNIRNTLNSLRCLATYVGPNALATFSNKIAPIATPIQDFAQVMVKTLGSTPLTASNVESLFQNNKVRPMPLPDNLCCKSHESIGLPFSNFCPLSNNYRLIHALFQSLKLSAMKEFEFLEASHNLCIEETTDIQLPRDFEVTEELREQMENNAENTMRESTSQNINTEVGFSTETFGDFTKDALDEADLEDVAFEEVWNFTRRRTTNNNQPSLSTNQTQLAPGNDAGFNYQNTSEEYRNLQKQIKTERKFLHPHKENRRVPFISKPVDDDLAYRIEMASLRTHFNDRKEKQLHNAITEHVERY